MAIRDALRNYIIGERFAGEQPPGFNDDYDLIDSGTIDSVFMVGLVTYLEREYRIEFGMNDFVPKNLKSVSALAEFVRSKAG